MNFRELLTKWKFEVDHKHLDDAEERLEKIQHRLEFLGAVEVVKGIFELTEKFTSFAEQLHVASESAGLTVEEFQKLAFAAGQSAVSQDEMGLAMARLGRNLYDARKGSAEAQKAFGLAGFTADQIAGFHTTKDAMLALSDRFHAIQDPIKKQAIAMELLGRGSHNMVGFLSKGSGAIKGLGDEAQRLGLLLTTKQVEALVSVEHSMQKLWAVIKNVGATIAVYLAPILNTGISIFLKFYEVNKKVIEVNVKQWAEDLAYVLGYIHGLVQGVVTAFLKFAMTHQLLMRRVFELFLALVTLAGGVMLVSRTLSALKALFGAFQVVLGPLAFAWSKIFSPAVFWMGGLLKRALTSLLFGFAEMASAALPAVADAFLALAAGIEATPIGWILTGIAALVVAVHDLWTILTGGNFSDTWIGKGWEALKGFGGKVSSFLGLGGESNSNAVSNVASVAGGLPGAGPAASPGVAAAAASAGGGSSVQVSAPITIQASPGMNEKQLAHFAAEKHREHLDRTLREASRSLTPVLAQ